MTRRGTVPKGALRGERTILFSAFVPGDPVPQGRPRVTATGNVYYETESVQYRRTLAWTFKSVKSGKPIDVPVAVTIVVFSGNPLADLDNYAKQILDAMVDGGVLLNDSRRIVKRIQIDDGGHVSASGVQVQVEVWQR